MLPYLTEHGFLPVPPVVHTIQFEDLPGCFGAKPARRQLWDSFVGFIDWLRNKTLVKEIYLDGRFVSASDDVNQVDVGIELNEDIVRVGGLAVFKIPALEEFSVRVRYFAPFRPDLHNFHEEFQTPDPEIRLRDASATLRKGYIKILI